MTVLQQNIVFDVPAGWSLIAEGGGLVLSTVGDGVDAQAQARIMVDRIATGVARDIFLLEVVQAKLAGCYPAYTVQTLLERPLALGTCVEAVLKPRQGSQLKPAQFYAVLLSRHLVLFDYRRTEAAYGLDPVARGIFHGIHEKGVTLAKARQFAAQRRTATRYVRRSLQQWQVFLCHNSKDKPEVRQLHDKLFEHGIVSWFDEDDIGSGDRFVPKIEEGLAHADAVVIALGSHGFGDWQELEYGAALNEYVRRKRAGASALKIIPVTLPMAPPLSDRQGLLSVYSGIEFKKSLHKAGIARLVQAIVPG